MFILRFFALILIVVGLMILGADYFSLLESSEGGFLQHTHSLGEVWGLVHSGSLDALFGGGSFIPDSVSATILGLPASLTLGGVGLILAFLFRARE